MTTAHPVNELLVVLGRRAIVALLWTLRDGPLAAPDHETAEHLEELRRNDLVAHDGAAWRLTPDGRALADQLLTLITRAQRRGGFA